MSNGDIGQEIDDAAATYGISLSPAEREAFVSEAETTAGLLGGLEPTAFESDPAGNVREIGRAHV